MSRFRPALIGVLAILLAGCGRETPPAEEGSVPVSGAEADGAPDGEAGGAPRPASAPAPVSASAPGAPAQPVPPGVLEAFVRVHGVDGVLDAWAVEMRRQWDQQVTHMRVKPGPGFWEESVADFDMEAQRRALLASVAAGLDPAEMARDVAWMSASGMEEFARQLEAVSARIRPHQEQLAAVARDPAAAGAPPEVREIGRAEHAPLHELMEELGYGAPDALEGRLVEALRQAMPDAPTETWTHPRLTAAARHAASRIEAEFAAEWTPGQATQIVATLRSPEGRRHDALMETLTPLVMARAEPFRKALQLHVLQRYARIYDAAWEEHQRSRGAPSP